MKLFNDWFSAYSKTSMEYSDRDLTRDAFRAGMLAAADIVHGEPVLCDRVRIAERKIRAASNG